MPTNNAADYSPVQFNVQTGDALGKLFQVAPGTAGQILVSNGASAQPSFQANAAATVWNDITGTSASMAVNNGYLSDNAALVTLTLPATAAQFTYLRVAGFGAGGWLIAQNAGQSIQFGSAPPTTVGVTGSLSSTNQFDVVYLLCVVADTTWLVLSSIGNLATA